MAVRLYRLHVGMEIILSGPQQRGERKGENQRNRKDDWRGSEKGGKGEAKKGKGKEREGVETKQEGNKGSKRNGKGVNECTGRITIGI